MAVVRRTFWFVSGLVSGVYGVFKVRRVIENFTPDGIGARVAAARRGIQVFAGEVATAAREREADLLAELRANAAERPRLEAADRAAIPAPRPAAPTSAPTQTTSSHTEESVTDGHR
jgi:hypothetical protein